MKKIRNVSLLLFSVALLFAGCSETSTNETNEVEDKNEIVWAGWSGQEEATSEAINGMIDDYNEQSENTKVDYVGWPWGDTLQQLIIRNQGSEILDIAQVDIGMFGALSEMDILVDFNELLGEEYLKETYENAALEVGNVNDKQIGLPWSIASIGMVYNPEILEAVGYENPPVTIAEFEDALAKIKDYDPSIIPYGVATKEETMATDFQPWLWTFGGNIFDEDGNSDLTSDEAIEATKWYKSLYENDYIQMNITRFDARQMFAEGKVAFYDDAIIARDIAEENGVDPDQITNKIKPMKRPVLDTNDSPQSAMWGHLLVAFEKSNNKEAAAEFAEHVVSEEQSIKYLESNGMPPVLKTAIESQTVKEDQWVDGWLEITETGHILEFALKSNSGELNNILVEELQSILAGDKEIENGLEDAERRLEQAE